jgi:hypothetical protein
MNRKNPMQELVEHAQREEARTRSEKYRRRLQRMFPRCSHLLENLYIHADAVDASDILKGKLPAGAVRMLKKDGLAVIRTASPRAMFFVSTGTCPGTGVIISFETGDGIALTLWNTEDTTEDSLCQIL